LSTGHRFLLLASLLSVGAAACAAPNPEFHELADVGSPVDGRAPDAESQLPQPDAMIVDGPAVPPMDGTSPPVVDLLTGLIGYWNMDESPGATVARDRSGLHHDGTLELLPPATSWIPGRFGTALHLPQDRNVGVLVPLTTRIAGIRQYTVAAWARRSRLRPEAYQSLISRQLGTGINEVFDMSVSKDLLQAYAPDRTTEGVSAAIAPNPAPVNAWFHAAATYDGQVIRVYQDGRPVAQVPWTAGLPASDRPLYLGTNKNESGLSESHHPWEGDLDEILLYEVALPAEAIAALAAGQRPNVSAP
jgi:hypothetical protein